MFTRRRRSGSWWWSLLTLLIAGTLAGEWPAGTTLDARAAESDAPATNPVTARGLEESANGRELVENAVDLANRVLGVGAAPSLGASWRASPTAAAIPVYLVVASGVVAGNAVGVPRSCRCVFIQMAALREWIAPHSTGTGRLPLNLAEVLAFMLLHEVGHVIQSEHAVDFDKGAFVRLNVEPSRAKAREERADEFAAKLIRDGVAHRASEVSLTAARVSVELSKLSWNQQAYRSLDEFGSTAVGKRSVFLDAGYDHPNLAWRVLRVNDLVQQTPESRQLLESFEAARHRGASPEPLYRAPGSRE